MPGGRLRAMLRTVRPGSAKAAQAHRVSPAANSPATASHSAATAAAHSTTHPAGHSAAHPAAGANPAAHPAAPPATTRRSRLPASVAEGPHDAQRDPFAAPTGGNVAIIAATTTDSLSISPPLGAGSFYLYHGGDTAPRQIDGDPTLAVAMAQGRFAKNRPKARAKSNAQAGVRRPWMAQGAAGRRRRFSSLCRLRSSSLGNEFGRACCPDSPVLWRKRHWRFSERTPTFSSEGGMLGDRGGAGRDFSIPFARLRLRECARGVRNSDMRVRSFIQTSATALATIFITPFLQTPATKLAEKVGFDKILSNNWLPTMSWLSDMATALSHDPRYIFVVGCVIERSFLYYAPM